MSVVKKDDIEPRLARLDDDIRKAQQRLDHDRVHGETDLDMTEEETKTQAPDKTAGAV